MHAEENKFKVYTQIAHLRVRGTPQVQIADVLGVTESRISQIVAEEAYKLIEAKLSEEIVEQNKSFNDGWDGLEAAAMDNLAKNLKFNQDPELCLKIAAVANKARRRALGSSSDAPVINGNGSLRANVGLPAHFVLAIQQNGGTLHIAQPVVKGKTTEPQQAFNTMAPGRVEQLFQKMEKEQNLLGSALEGIDVAEAMKS